MKAGITYNDRNIRYGETVQPSIKSDEVLLETAYAGICGTDLHIFRGEFHERVKYPAIQGHEFGGFIREAGREVRGFQPGDCVVVDPIIPCHRCSACLSGHLNACRTLQLLGVDLDGGFGQFVAVPASHLYHFPSSIPMETMPMVEMYALGCHILQRGQVQPGETVAILGAGKLGLSILDVLCHSASPSRVFITDLQPFRLEVARKLGVEASINITAEDPINYILDLTDGEGVDCVIEAVGHYHLPETGEAPLAQAVKMIRSGGRIVTAGLGEQLSSVHFKTLVLKEAQIIASRVTRGEFPRAIRLMEMGLLHPHLLITEQMSLSKITTAFRKVDQDDPDTIKIVLNVQEP